MKSYETLLLAKKYAQAFFNSAGISFDSEALNASLELSSFLKNHRYIYALLCIPTLPHSSKAEALRFLFKKFSIDDSLQKLLFLLLEQGRIDGIDAVLNEVHNEYYKRHDIELFKIISSHTLKPQQQKTLKVFVQKLVGKTIRVEYKVDSRLIVGLRVQSTSSLWERSIKKELLEISTQIAQKGMS